MKTPPIPIRRARARGFTLIELLVVISIIVVLAAMAAGAANLVMKRAQKTQAAAVEHSIDLAIQNYFSEYAKYPDLGGNMDDIDTTTETGKKLITILLGKESTSSGNLQNPRQVVYLNVADGKGKKGGLIYDSSGNIQGIYDPWGNGFHIAFDDDYDDQIQDPDPIAGASQQPIRNKKCVIWSAGPDKKKGTADDVRTWSTN